MTLLPAILLDNRHILASMLLMLLVILLGACTADTEQASTPKPPNIIFILADDLGYGDLGCYGQEQITTPRLDQIAAAGMRFTRHYAGSTVCAPSRCVLMTGKHTGHAIIRGNSTVALPSDEVTVAEVLQSAGYHTGLIGKWGLGEAESEGIPNRQGFNEFFGYLNQVRAHNYYPDYLWENTTQFPLQNEVQIVSEGYAAGVGSYSTNRVTYSHDLFTDRALDFVRSNSDTTFFLYLAYTIPHANNEGRWNDTHGMEVPEYGAYTDTDWPDAQKGHAAMISLMDRDIGMLLDALNEKGIAENTLVIFSSDNGPHQEGGADPTFFDSNGPLRGIKRDLYEGGIRVPTLAYWPGTIAAGSTTDHPSAFWDFFPTACDVAGIPLPDSQAIDGISYLPTLVGQQQPRHDYLYWEFHEQGKKQAVIQDDWKLVYLLAENSYELYNLKDDIGETTNLAAENPDKLQVLQALMQNARTENPYFEWVAER